MKKFTNQSYMSHADRMNNGGGKFRRIALFPLMLLMLLLLPTRMVAQTANGNTSNQAYAEFDNSSGTFTFKCGPKPAGAYDLNEGEKLPKWFAQKDKIKTVVFDASFANARPTSCYYWFCFCYNLTTIEGIEYLNTEKVTNMKDMFYRCSALTSLDLSNFNTAEVTDMTEMFCSCSALTTIFVSDKFVTGQVTSSVDMFSGCDKLIGAIKYDGKNTNNKDYANYKTGYFAPEGGFPDYAVFDGGTGTLTFRSGPSTSKPEGAYDLNVGTSRPGWSSQRKNIKTVVFDASFANARLTNCYAWFYGCNNLTTIEGIEYLNTENVTNMDGMFDNCCALTSLNLTSFNTAKVESMSGMFYNCCALTSLDLSNFNTANVTDMSKMFEGCSALTSLNLSNFNTAGVKDMYCMFCVCSALTSLDLSNFNTAEVTDMSLMFEGCSALTSLDLSNFNTAEVTDMTEMFEGCSALTTIFVSDKFVTDHVTNSSNMFSGCDKLIGAIKYDGKNTNNKDYANYETGYFALEGRFPGYAVFDKGTGTLTFRSGPSTSKPEGAYDLNVGTSLPGWFAQREEIKTVVFDASFANARPTSCHCWFYFCTNLTTIEGIEYLNTEKVTNMSGMFHNCSDLISLDVTHFNTENVTSMIGMFDGCAGLISLDVTNFNTANVTDMSNMFNNCSALTSLNLSNFNTANVTDMSNMFYNCPALTTIFVSDKFVTDHVTNSSNMFRGCNKLIGAIEYDENKLDHNYANYENGYFSPEGGFHAYAELDESAGTLTFKRGLTKPEGAYDLNEGRNLPDWNNLGTNVKKVVFDASFASARPTNCYGWFKDFTNMTTIEGFEYLNTENVTNMTGVFNGCSALTSLDLTNFNTAKVTDMKLLFANCSALESLDLSMFNTENVTSMPSMFNGATNLKTLNVSNFNTEKVNNMGHMFANCPNLTSLDLSSFNTKGVEYVDNIFKNCSNLTTIYASEIFAFGSGLKNGADMFLGCDKLKGAIKYDENKTDHTYANYKTGYFTKLVGKNGDEKIGATGETLTAESLALDDDKDFVAYEPFAATTASYSRTMKTGTTWGTLCLPFEVSLDGQNFRAFKLLSADEGTGTVELEELNTSIAAGTPVIIKMNEGATQLDFSVTNKEIAKDVQTAETADGNYQLQGLYTQKMFSKDVDNNCYIVKGNQLMNPAKLLENTKVTKVASKPFRAYMVDNSSAAAGAKMFSIGFNDNTTAIDNLNTIANDKAVYYDIQGLRLNAPQKGINIVKRGNKTMKVIIK